VEAKAWDRLEEEIKEKVNKILIQNEKSLMCSKYIVVRLMG
jgi:hypothetical protein